MKYLRKMLKSKTINAAIIQLLGIGTAYLQGGATGKEAGLLAAQAALQIALRLVTKTAISEK